MNAVPQPRLVLQACLARENEQPERHEFHRGEVFAKVGARRVQGCIVGHRVRHLGNVLTGSPCRAFSDGMKIGIADDTVLYPDVFVTCDKADLKTDLPFRSPTLVIEVLSPGTQGCDRSQKFALYRRLPALQECILIDPDTRRVEAFRRNDDHVWSLFDISGNTHPQAASIDARIGLAALFDGVAPPPEAAAMVA